MIVKMEDPKEHRQYMCRVYWGTHGCSLARGHEGNHFCTSTCDVGDISNRHIHFYGEDWNDNGRTEA